MTVGELLEELKKYPPELPALVRTDDFYGYYSPVNTVDKATVATGHAAIEEGIILANY